jgi:AraC-like DNA-binding protein
MNPPLGFSALQEAAGDAAAAARGEQRLKGSGRRQSTPMPHDVLASMTGEQPLALIEVGERPDLIVCFWRFSQGGTVRFNDRRYHILAYRQSGAPVVCTRAAATVVSKRPRIGSVTFVRAGTPTAFTWDQPCSSCHIYIDDAALCAFGTMHLGMHSKPRIPSFFGIEDPWLRAFFDLLIAEYHVASEARPDTPFFEHARDMLMRYFVLHHAAGEAPAPAAIRQLEILPLSSARLARVVEFVDSNLHTEISLESLSGVVSMSTFHFLRSFRAATGATPYHYLIERRLERAAAMLREGDEDIARIAHACGFAKAGYFSARFHRKFGLSPLAFRKSHRHIPPRTSARRP